MVTRMRFWWVIGMLALVAWPAHAQQGSDPAKESLNGQVAGSQQDYLLGADDVIDVFVWKEPDLSATMAIRPDGKISLPLIGEIQAAGRTAQQLQQEVTRQFGQFVNNPVVTVMVKEFNSFKVSVLGEVRTPGVYKVSHTITVLDAIALAGGFTEFARQDRVVVIRGTGIDGQRININLKKYIKSGNSDMLHLDPADVVYVR
jgi:polysaccharide biosynthesis/export protein